MPEPLRMTVDTAVEKQARGFRFTEEIGRGGLSQYGGILQEEFLRELRGDRWHKTVREMSTNDEIIGGILFAIDATLRKAKWDIQAGDETPEDQARADFLRQALFDDLDQTWSDTVSEWLTFVPFGWAVCEMTMKVRNGAAADPLERSLFDDRKIGWRKIALRGQETLARWVFSEAGDVTAMVQRDPVSGKEYTIPLEKCLHFRHRPQRGNPEGTSTLRAVYKTWYTKKRLQAFEAIGIERDLGGYPVVQLKEDAPDLWNTKDANATATLTALKKFVKSVRRDEQEGAIVPAWAEFKLLTTGSRRSFDTSAIITRHDQRIAIAFLWDIMLLGHEAIGTQALAQSKLDLLAMSLDGFLDTITTIVNRFAVPLLFRLNGDNPDKLPRLFHDTIKATDLVGLGDFIMKLSQAGAAIFPNEDIERYLLRRADLPVPEETLQGTLGDGDLDVE